MILVQENIAQQKQKALIQKGFCVTKLIIIFKTSQSTNLIEPVSGICPTG
jgi:hypothetical protein